MKLLFLTFGLVEGNCLLKSENKAVLLYIIIIICYIIVQKNVLICAVQLCMWLNYQPMPLLVYVVFAQHR